ncbi:MAG TPA: DUF4328 domain-containing protein [Actinomycetota bacterium]|nr:DUF4328 domain-containing protein [Actinomycetota bacterium]
MNPDPPSGPQGSGPTEVPPELRPRGLSGSWRGQLWAPPDEPFKALTVAGPLKVLLAIGVLLDVLIVAVWYLRYSFAQRAVSGGSFTDAEVTTSDMMLGLTGIGQLLVFTTTGILFIVWVRRAYRNLHPLGVQKLRFKAGWAVGGWFVPFLNAVRPKEIVNDIWRSTDPDAPREQEGPGLGRPVEQIVNWWWASYLVSQAAYQFIFRMPIPETAEQLVNEAQVGMVSDALGAVAGVTAFLAVGAITKRHDERAAALGVTGGPPALPVQESVR